MLVLDLLLLDGLIDGQLCLFESESVSMLLAGQALLEVKLDLRSTHSLVKDLVGQSAGQLLEALIGRESLGLDLIFVCFFVKRQAISSDGSINSRAEVSVIFDDVPLESLDLDVFASLVHLAEDLDSLALDLCETALLDLGFLESNLLSAVSMLLLVILLTLNKGALKQIQALILQTLDVVFAFGPLTDLLILHQTATEGETGLVRGGWQGILKGTFLSHLLNELHLSHTGGEAFTVKQVLNCEHLKVGILLVDHVLRREWISLSLGLSTDDIFMLYL